MKSEYEIQAEKFLKDNRIEMVKRLHGMRIPPWGGDRPVNAYTITLTKKDGPYQCCEDRCAWWRVYYRGGPEEYGECVVNAIFCLMDMV